MDNPRIRRIRKNSVNNIVKPVIREKRAEIPEQYNEITVEFRDKSKLQFRLYNDGFAYRFILDLPGTIIINNDIADFVFDKESLLTYQKIIIILTVIMKNLTLSLPLQKWRLMTWETCLL